MGSYRAASLLFLVPCICFPLSALAQGSKTYPVTSYRITRYSGTTNEAAYIELKNGTKAVAYVYFQKNPPQYGYHSSGSDYVTKAFDLDRFDDIVGMLRHERLDNVYGSWDGQDRVTFFILNSNARVTFANQSTTVDDSQPEASYEVPKGFRVFEVQDGVLRIKGDD